MKTASKTDIGRIRQVNEDSAYVSADLNGFTLAIVADGMGGHQAGDKASQMATQIISEHLQAIHTDMDHTDCMEQIKQAISIANLQIFQFAKSDQEYAGMGTTVVVALVARDMLVIAHIGDSRAYLCNEDGLTRLTEDHSLVNELVKSGQITLEEADNHPRKNVLIRALGTENEVEADLHPFPWREGDMLLLCSDGLSGLVQDEQIKFVLCQDIDVQEKAERLVHEALQVGGDDNITAVLIYNNKEAEEETE